MRNGKEMKFGAKFISDLAAFQQIPKHWAVWRLKPDQSIPCPLGAHNLEEADTINRCEVHKRSAEGECGSE